MTTSYADALAGILGTGGDDLVAGAELLEALLARPAWHARAACRGVGPSLFFADDAEAAQDTCAGCPVRLECAEAGQKEPAGVWGGTSARERRRARRKTSASPRSSPCAP